MHAPKPPARENPENSLQNLPQRRPGVKHAPKARTNHAITHALSTFPPFLKEGERACNPMTVSTGHR